MQDFEMIVQQSILQIHDIFRYDMYLAYFFLHYNNLSDISPGLSWYLPDDMISD